MPIRLGSVCAARDVCILCIRILCILNPREMRVFCVFDSVYSQSARDVCILCIQILRILNPRDVCIQIQASADAVGRDWSRKGVRTGERCLSKNLTRVCARVNVNLTLLVMAYST